MLAEAMTLKPFGELKKTLSFRPQSDTQSLKTWPQALLPVAWQGELLCGFNATTTQAWELDPELELKVIAQYFLELHPDLAILDLFVIRSQSKSISWGETFFTEIIKQQAKGQGDQWHRLFENLSLLPKALLGQWQIKRLQWGDLRPLLSLEKSEAENLSWTLLTMASFSKSEWTQTIEYFTDLVLMETNFDGLESLQDKPRELLQKLKELRFPETSKKDLLAMEFWKKLPWPKNTQAEFRRQGDQAKTYVSMNFSSVKDLRKLTDELNKMVKDQEQRSESLL